ncbi:hypothetical protein E3O55_18880 [Cryobacterium sp. MDB1-18-2]|uniref:hypothetical protein n=1 Tax=unclassified Cryobacterium TaxID=2649013 RepID=UPI00106BF8C4|nr:MULTISPECIES: hypothetical protein [unclassified Cryobacterium]TFC22083.1 hypothetical protein E3O55_18880 [Cryobacterium sp. MDB1-18-2]TFC40656.1 hypothetical protein E3O50_12675 [Cryobacterium sp. MDB1-18-1]
MIPKRLWDDVADFTRSAVADFAPTNCAEASKALTVISRLAVWTTETACLPLERNIVFSGRHIETFAARQMAGLSPVVARAERLRLLRIAGELHSFDPVRRDAGKKPRPNPFAPYSPAAMVRFRSQAATRSTALRRHNWMVLLALAAGCALTTTEIMHLKVEDVDSTGDGLTVTVRGASPRTVVCLADWEDDVTRLLGGPLVSDYLFVKAERPNNAVAYVTKFLNSTAKGGEFPTVERLRSTWIVGHLEARTPTVALAEALGVKTFSTFERLAPFVKTPDASDLRVLFRGELRP